MSDFLGGLVLSLWSDAVPWWSSPVQQRQFYEKEQMIAHFHSSSQSVGLLSRDPRNLFLSDGGWFLEGLSLPLGTFEATHRGLSPSDTSTVLSLLQTCTPMWSRLGPGSGQLDNYLSRLTYWIDLILRDLRGLGVKYAIFHTSSPHHASTICLQIACQIAQIPTTYLYSEIVGGRSMPVSFSLFGTPLTPLGAEISSHDPGHNIELFADSAVIASTQWFEKKLLPKVSRSLYFSSAILVAWGFISPLKRGFRRVRSSGRRGKSALNTFESEVDLDFLGRRAWSIGEEFSTMKVQNRAIEVLKEESKRSSYSQGEGRAVLFYAHFQPEASTFPEQGVVMSQMLRALDSIRDAGWGGPIVFREHPATLRYFGNIVGPTRVGVARSANFYRQLTQAGVHLQWPEDVCDSFPDAIVATLAGSIALERALQGQPTLVLGRPWFGRIPGSVEMTSDTAWLASYDRLMRADGIRAEAVAHLVTLLRGTTIKNPHGIGYIFEKAEETSNSSTSAEREYIEEMGRLADWLVSNHEPR